jgi:hypothetical protein
MRTSLIIGTLCVLGAGAAGVGATFATQPFNGSDTLFNLTNQAMVGSGLGNSGDYVGGGSGAGENNMAANPPKQWMAPMSKMMTSTTCTAHASDPTHASGVVIGLDAVDVYSSVFSGATAACSNHDTMGTNGLGLAYSTKLSYTDINGNAETLTFANWTDVLALLYGGLDKSLNNAAGSGTGYSDCNSPQRKALVANWSNLFEANGAAGSSGSTCGTNPSSACTTASYHAGAASISINGQLWHAFRRDDASGTSDAFAGIIGLGTLYTVSTSGSPPGAGASLKDKNAATLSYSVSASKNNGFGVTPYCNAMNWDTTAANVTSAGVNCALHAFNQFVGPGGVPQLFCSVGGAACPSGSAIGSTCNTTGTCTWDGIHKRPPPNTWGDVSAVVASKNIGADVLPTAFQDNDPIRRQCIGLSNLIGAGNPAEEVCNIDNPLGAGVGNAGQLGLVVPMPEVDWITQVGTTNCAGALCPTKATYPTTTCSAFLAGSLVNTYLCAPSGLKTPICPDGAAQNGGCQFPVDSTGSSFCENNPSKWPVGVDTTKSDGRLFNLIAYDGTGTATTGPIQFAIPGTATAALPAGISVPMMGMFARLHMTLPIWDHGASTTPPTLPGGQAQGPCLATDMTDQIACLTQADPCSVGYAGDGGKSWNVHQGRTLAVAGSDAMEVSQVYPTTAGVQDGKYPFWRKLYYNTSNGFDRINGTTTTYTDGAGATDTGLAELALGQYESNTTSIDSLLSTFSFFGLGHSPNGGGDAPYCEDFNENMLCSATTFPSNLNACNFNATALSVAANSAVVNAGGSSAIPSDVSSDPTMATTSTVCGNGKVEAFEDCDFALTPTTCSKTCRVALP